VANDDLAEQLSLVGRFAEDGRHCRTSGVHLASASG
jgi:hypothetical protein